MRAFRPNLRIFDRLLLRTFVQVSAVCLLLIFIVGAGDTSARYQQMGHHQLICTCGCGQILLECNHVGCTVSTQEEGELRTALDRGDSDQLILQNFVQKYGPTVLAAPPESGFNLSPDRSGSGISAGNVCHGVRGSEMEVAYGCNARGGLYRPAHDSDSR